MADIPAGIIVVIPIAIRYICDWIFFIIKLKNS